MSSSASMSNAYFQIAKGKLGRDYVIADLQLAASTAIASGSALAYDGSAYYNKATASTATQIAILMEDIAATDADYATAGKLKKCLIPLGDGCEFYFKVVAGTFTVADVGKTVKFSDETGLAVDTAGAAGAAHAKIKSYISSAKGTCSIIQYGV